MTGLEAMAQKLVDASEGNRKPLDTPQARLFEGACAVCHARGGPDLFGRKWPLALNANVYGDRPDNLIRIILDGSVAIDPAHGAMPAFRHSLNDRRSPISLAMSARRSPPPNPRGRIWKRKWRAFALMPFKPMGMAFQDEVFFHRWERRNSALCG